MSTTDTQTIRAEIVTQIQKAEQELSERPSLENIAAVRWLKSKLAFYESEWHKIYKQQN